MQSKSILSHTYFRFGPYHSRAELMASHMRRYVLLSEEWGAIVGESRKNGIDGKCNCGLGENAV